MVQPFLGAWPLQLFTNRSQMPELPLLKQTFIPLPDKPLLIRTVLFSVISIFRYMISRERRQNLVRISTEGQFPGCDICYSHFCHRFFLRFHRGAIATTWARRWARTLTHQWCAAIEQIAFRHATKIVVPSNGIKHELELTYPHITSGKIHVIPNPIDTVRFARPPYFSSGTIRKALGIPDRVLVLSFCALGGFTRKGLTVVLEALAESGDPAIHLIVVGGHPTEISDFKTLAKRLGVEETIHFAGLQQDIRTYLWCSDVFVFPSSYEGFPLVCLQAAAAGLPLIATRINGVEDFLIHGVNGWLVERTAESVAGAIRDAAGSPEKTAQMGRTAQEQVQAYGVEVFQSRWLSLLKEDFGIDLTQASAEVL